MAGSASAQEQTPRRWLPAALAAMVIYPAIGIGFAFLDSASVPAGVRFWRLAAWVVSALVFGAHLVHELRRTTTNPLVPLPIRLRPRRWSGKQGSRP
jgi:hypothetical protein